MKSSPEIFDLALRLTLAERAALVEQLLISLDEPDSQIDALLTEEVEQRINSYEAGEMQAIPAHQVFAKFE